MRQLEPDLWQTSVSAISETVGTNAYLLTRPTGNLLIYGLGYGESEGRGDDLDQIEHLGGVVVQLLSHRDEASPSLNVVRERFGSRLACSALEEPAIRAEAEVDLIVGSDCADPLLDGLEILETPGHTDGSISFRYRSPHGKSYLFTGDTIFRWDDHWGTFVFSEAGGDAADLKKSLKSLRELEPDWVISSAFFRSVGAGEVSGTEWSEIVDAQIARLG